MSWDQVLTVSSGKVWFERAREEGRYKVTARLDCVSENEEPFKVWFEKVDYRPDFEVPDQERGFPITTWVLPDKRRLRLKARLEPEGEPPLSFRRFCKSLVDSEAVQEQYGYALSTDIRVRFPRHTQLHDGEPPQLTMCDPRFEQTEGNFVRFAHFAEPFTLIPDPGLHDLKAIRSPEDFANVLNRVYGWALDKH